MKGQDTKNKEKIQKLLLVMKQRYLEGNDNYTDYRFFNSSKSQKRKLSNEQREK